MILPHAQMAPWSPPISPLSHGRLENSPTTIRSLHHHSKTKNKRSKKWAVLISLPNQSFTTSPKPITTLDMKDWTRFLHDEMSHVFDRGIDQTAYDEDMKYRDPITKLDGFRWYLLNMAMLRTLFRGQCHLHWAKQTGEYEITTRWTALMEYNFLKWRPRLVFTGNSILKINPQTNKIKSQVDYWDSIKNNSHFSFEGLLDVINQVDETPRVLDYQVLKRTATYEVRKYHPFVVSESHDHMLSRSEGNTDLGGPIFWKHSSMKKIPLIDICTQELDAQACGVPVRTTVVPLRKDLTSLPTPNGKATHMRKVEGGFAAVAKFSGKPDEDVVRLKEEILRSNLVKDDLKPRLGYFLSRCNDHDGTWRSFILERVQYFLITYYIVELCPQKKKKRRQSHT